MDTDEMTDVELLSESDRLAALAESRRDKGDPGFHWLHPALESWLSSDEANAFMNVNQEIHRRLVAGAADRVKARRTARLTFLV